MPPGTNDMKTITWKPLLVKVADLKENPNNPKIVDERGKARLRKSLLKFGLAGTIVCNLDLLIIDGHSRKKELIEANIVEVWVSVPDHLLTKAEYDEFNAIYDAAKAGNTDVALIEKLFTEDFLTEWDIDKPLNPNKLSDDFSLKSGDKSPFQQMTFTLADVQADLIKRAISAVEIKPEHTYANENGNGNALHQIVFEWAERKKLS